MFTSRFVPVSSEGFVYHGRYYPYIRGGSDEGEGNDAGNQGGDGDSGNSGGEGGSNDSGGDSSANNRGDLHKALEQERRERKALTKKLEEKDRAEREATEAAARQKGEYERLYNELKATHETEVGTLKAELFKRDAERSLLTYLGEKHPSHVARVRWLWPILSTELTADMDEETVKATVKRVADEYVKDHPMDTQNGGAPGSGNRNGGNHPPADPLANFGSLKQMLDRTAPPVGGSGGK